MTVSQLRDRMTEKVVPEKLMPQNIVEFLMDEDAELPELDAFTFLNRLRALGIGSADFLYLLSGCGAPAEAVEKVRKNPAMNLQGLILTLDGAGLTSQDYTRMLYTARQLWERTLTMRLEDEEQNEPAPVSAEEAYEATNSIIDKYNTTEIQNIKSEILDTINEGHFDLFVYRHISDLAKEYFENKNYKITENDDRCGHLVKISWNRTERI